MTPDEQALRDEIALRIGRLTEMAKDLDEPWNLTGIMLDGHTASRTAMKLAELLTEKRNAAKPNGAGEIK